MLSTGMKQTISSAGNADQAIVMEHDSGGKPDRAWTMRLSVSWQRRPG